MSRCYSPACAVTNVDLILVGKLRRAEQDTHQVVIARVVTITIIGINADRRCLTGRYGAPGDQIICVPSGGGAR